MEMFRTLHQVLRLSRAPGAGGAGTPPRQRKIVLVAETGCDLTPERAGELGVYLVPMHVSMGLETRPDGSFPPEEVCAYYDRTGEVPQTSAAWPRRAAGTGCSALTPSRSPSDRRR